MKEIGQTPDPEKLYVRKLRFPSHERTCIKDITTPLNQVLAEFGRQSGINSGEWKLSSLHTSAGLLICETQEPGLLQDMIDNSLKLIPEDRNGTWLDGGGYEYPTSDYLHDCMANPLRSPDEIDQDRNAGRHIRAGIFAHQTIEGIYQDDRVVLGKYQGIAFWEFDGRDGTGINPERTRTLLFTAKPAIMADTGITYINI